MNIRLNFRASILPVVLLCVGQALAATTPAEPYINPYLAKSTFAMAHHLADFTSVPGPTGSTRRLSADEVKWKPVGPMNAYNIVYSSPYPNGKRVAWVGGYDRVAKLDADTLEILTTLPVGEDVYYSEDQIHRYIDTMDRSTLDEKLKHIDKVWSAPTRQITSSYRVLSSDNELYLPRRNPDGSLSLRVYGEADASDPASKISLRRQWDIPTDVSKTGLIGMGMTSDGHVVIATLDGVLFALSRDLKQSTYIRLPKTDGITDETDVMKSLVRNNFATDDHNGIYVVTRNFMHRVQWTGTKLSLDEADGAWKSTYPNENGLGSGTSPALMGWGDKEDHLVVIADGTRGNNMMAFWRDAIPADWKGIPGYDRRVAGITKVKFGVSPDEEPQVEVALVVYGYGAFIESSNPVSHLPDLGGGRVKQYLTEMFLFNMPKYATLGGAKVEWDPKQRVLRTEWSTQANLLTAVCNINAPTKLLYCWSGRNSEWGLEALDWETGKSVFRYPMGTSERYNSYAGWIEIAPNGAVDCACVGGMGIVRVQPKATRAKKAKQN